MKKLFAIVSVCMLAACSDPLDLSQKVNNVPDAGDISTQGIGPAPGYTWTSMHLPHLPGPNPINSVTGTKTFLTVNGNAYWFIGSVCEFPYKLNNTTQRWEPFDGPESIPNIFFGGYNFLFSYGTKFYFGFRPVGGDPYGDERVIYSHDVVTGDTDELPDFPGTITQGSAFVVAGSKFYILGGHVNNVSSSQYWEFNLITNQWTNKGSLPGGSRTNTVAYVVHDKLYYGLGYELRTFNGQTIKRYKNDWYMMTPGGTVASIKADFPGDGRSEADGFVIKNKIHVGWGKNSLGTHLNDFWEYNVSNNTWSERSNCPSAQGGPRNMEAFAIGETGYFIRGWLGEFWRYSDSPFTL